ncbi:MAG: response regulator [Lentisphaeria bacterium]|nr:response regulator [Lentisphaeria bacterium]
MTGKKQRISTLLYLAILLVIFLLPVCFAVLLFQNMRKLCTAAFEAEATAIAGQITGMDETKIIAWYRRNPRSGSLYIWLPDTYVPFRLGDDNDVAALIYRPSENTTEIRETHNGKSLLCTSRKLTPDTMFMLCRETDLVYSKIHHGVILLAGFALFILPGLLLLFYRFSIHCNKTTAGTICHIITDTPQNYPDTGDRNTDQKIHDLAQEFLALNKRNEHDRRINMEKVASLAAGMAHDFGNLLTVFRGNLELAEMMAQPGPVKNNLLECKSALDATVKLNNQFLSFAKGGSPITAQVAPEDFFKRQTAFILRARKTTAEFTCAKNLPDAMMDAAQIYHVLNNILINASHAMNEEGVIHIELTSVHIHKKKTLKLNPGLYLRVRISDSGAGIPPENREKIFYPFYTTRHNGNGLGLPMCMATMQRHNGMIRAIEPPSGKGACFELYLPAIPTEKKETVSPAQQPDETEYQYRGGGKILIVDDQPSICQLLRKILEIMNCQCECAANEQECLEKYRAAEKNGTPFDLVFMDLTMPGDTGGAEILQKLRKEFPNVRAIAASGYSDNEILADHQNFGFTEKLLKPFRMKDVNRIMYTLFPERR